jgi:hypothetical protein
MTALGPTMRPPGFPDDVQEQIVVHLSALETQRLRSVSPVFLRVALRARYSRVRVDFCEDSRRRFSPSVVSTLSTTLMSRIQ